MSQSTLHALIKVSLIGACSVFAPFVHADEPGQIIAANYGSANLPAAMSRLVCPEAAGLDGMPVHFETEVAGPVSPEDFLVRGKNGEARPVICATLEPSDDVGEQRSVLLIGEFGDAEDQPVSVEVVGDIRATDNSLSYRGAQASFTPLEAPPGLILAEVVPEQEWALGETGSRLPWGGGTACPADGTVQVLRVGWGGGIRAADGNEVTAQEWKRYKVAIRAEDGDVSLVTPFAVGDLNDNDNNHELCLDRPGTPMEVRFPAGLLIDPNGDLNEASRIEVNDTGAI